VFFQRLGRDLKQIIENVYTCTVCLCVWRKVIICQVKNKTSDWCENLKKMVEKELYALGW
jgi:hypothetical protein